MTAIQLISPVDGSVWATRMPFDLEKAEAAVVRARRVQPAWAALPLEDRITAVRGGVAKLNEMKDQLVEELAWQMGRPISFGAGEFSGVTQRTEYLAAIAAEGLAPVVVEDSPRVRRVAAREPAGVVLIIASWNYPFLTVINTLIQALIAGNSVLLKHASQTLVAGERLAEAFHNAGVPPEIFQNVVLDHETTEALIAARSFDFIRFTGSVEGGRAIERAAAGTFTRIGLETAGKDPGYVRDDADLDAAVDGLMDGSMFNSGQGCSRVERIYVQQDRFDDFVEKAVVWVEGLRLGSPFDPATTLGPMAKPHIAQRVRDHVAEAVATGARALISPDGFRADDGAAYLAPQVLIDVDHSMRVMKDETFGPVVGIMKVSSDDEAISLMNDSRYGLTCSIWSGDVGAVEKIGARVQTGTVYMNRCDYLDPALGWTGCKDSGHGIALSHLGYHAVTRPKSYYLKRNR
ncbi:MAG: aldehyde dehydrogenase family protein [Pseudorhodobacter sp.]